MNAFMSFLPARDERGDAVMDLGEIAVGLQQYHGYKHVVRDWNPGAGAAQAARVHAPIDRYPTLCHALAHRMDPYMRLHDRRRRDDLAEVVRCRILSFLTSPMHVDALGHRESQMVARFFERLTNGYKMANSSPKDICALERFLSFWLDVKVSIVSENGGEAAPTGITFVFNKGSWEARIA